MGCSRTRTLLVGCDPRSSWEEEMLCEIFQPWQSVEYSIYS